MLDSEILWGTFRNTATITGLKVLTCRILNLHTHKNLILVVAKTAENTDFIVGETATFDIYVYNRGIGYANNATVEDDIAELNFFSSWTITFS